MERTNEWMTSVDEQVCEKSNGGKKKMVRLLARMKQCKPLQQQNNNIQGCVNIIELTPS